MKRIEGLLQIGGSSKNIGKTSFVLSIIQRFSLTHDITAIKISPHHPEYDKTSILLQTEGFTIYKESHRNSLTDTSKMLNFGANESFFIQSDKDNLESAFKHLLSLKNNKNMIVCESNILRHFFIPDIFIMLKSDDVTGDKNSAKELYKFADIILNNDELIRSKAVSTLGIDKCKWFLNKYI
ncbi:MAG: hypothetical protein PHT69_07430 [Bacteroidales bacterium]|nr:hypothetical protein [Bacteroidales bacterium]